MPLEVLTGEMTPGPTILAEADTEKGDYLENAVEGQAVFMRLDSLWAHPETRALYINAMDSTYTELELAYMRLNVLDFVRVIPYKGEYVVDATHAAEHALSQHGANLTVDEAPTKFLEQFLETSVPATAYIRESVTLGMFIELLQDHYGDKADLEPLELEFSVEDQSDDD